MQAKRKTIGIRVPDNAVTQCLLDELGEPLMSTTLIMPGEELPLADPWEMRQTLEHEVDLVIDGGFCGFEATSVIAFEDDVPVLVRQGKGSVEDFV
jgi:tRNA A37 threonylcarbamoyladenosine synthetase subunit TsaC/SUA5/YrdC